MQWIIAFTIVVVAASALDAADDQWVLSLREDFDSPACLTEWSLDGPADVSVTADGKLRIKTEQRDVGGEQARCSVLWRRQPIWGDLRFEFDCQADPKSRCLFFFNARGNGADRGIFTWERPLAAYGDYAYEPRMELYTMGMLRSDQTLLNLRRLGGSALKPEWCQTMPYNPVRFPERWLSQEELTRCLATAGIESLPDDPRERAQLMRKPPFKAALAPHLPRYKQIWQDFQDVSIIASHKGDKPAFADPDKFHHMVVTVRGIRVTVEVNGETLVDFEDKTRPGGAMAGGYFGLRNFVPTAAQYDNLRVYRLAR